MALQTKRSDSHSPLKYLSLSVGVKYNLLVSVANVTVGVGNYQELLDTYLVTWSGATTIVLN